MSLAIGRKMRGRKYRLCPVDVRPNLWSKSPAAPHIRKVLALICINKFGDIRRAKISSAFVLLFVLDIKFMYIFTVGANILIVTSHFALTISFSIL